MALEFLDTKHPVFRANEALWLRNERRLRGGDDVLDELRKFDWETANGEHVTARRGEATYVNFPDIFATSMVGHLMGSAPQPGSGLSFGRMGDVTLGENVTRPTEADLVYFNTDGVGNDGSLWDNFWTSAFKNAMGTGHRWIMAEAPPDAPAFFSDVLGGARPYLVEHSPSVVTNWHYENGSLAFAILKLQRDILVIKDGAIQGQSPNDVWTLFMVREGYDLFGDGFSGGGWWWYDADKKIQNPERDTGDWSKTDGQIPLFPLFYERDTGTKDHPNISRSAITELGQVAVSYMNLASAADYDAWDAGGSVNFLLGVTREAHNVAMDALAEGSKYVPLAPGPDTNIVPSVHDASQGAVASEVFNARLETKRLESQQLASMEATSTPDSSGTSKRAGFGEIKAPRLALMASEIEQAQQMAVEFLEMRFGHAEPAGHVSWPREFDLLELVDEIEQQFALEQLAGIKSATLGAKAMTLAAKERNLIADEAEEDLVRTEYQASGSAAATEEVAAGDVLTAFGA
jgi:hypothetical protein